MKNQSHTRCRKCGCFAVAWKNRKDGSFYLGLDQPFKGNRDRSQLAYEAKASLRPHSCDEHHKFHQPVAEANNFDAWDVAGYDIDDLYAEEWDRVAATYPAEYAAKAEALAELAAHDAYEARYDDLVVEAWQTAVDGATKQEAYYDRTERFLSGIPADMTDSEVAAALRRTVFRNVGRDMAAYGKFGGYCSLGKVSRRPDGEVVAESVYHIGD